MGATILLIFQGAQLVATLLPSTLQAINAIRGIFAASGSDFTTQIVQLEDGAVAASQATLDRIAAWKAANGYTD